MPLSRQRTTLQSTLHVKVTSVYSKANSSTRHISVVFIHFVPALSKRFEYWQYFWFFVEDVNKT